jgi:hypothetical protein
MTNTDKESSNELLSTLRSLMDKSFKANATLLKGSGRVLTSLLAQKMGSKDLTELNKRVLNVAFTDFVKMQIKHTEELMDLGVQVSQNIVSFIDKASGPATGSPKPAASENTGQANNQINLSVRPGEQLSTSFFLNNNSALSQSGKFYYEDFIDSVTGKKVVLSMLLSPREFTIEPGQSLKVDLNIGATSDVVPGKYRASIRLDGMNGEKFDIVVQVMEIVEPGQPGPKKKAGKGSS